MFESEPTLYDCPLWQSLLAHKKTSTFYGPHSYLAAEEEMKVFAEGHGLKIYKSGPSLQMRS